MSRDQLLSQGQQFLWYCGTFDSQWKYITISLTKDLTIFVYSVAFMLGLRNIWLILIRKGYYRSLYMSLQYLFGQLICITRIFSAIYFSLTL